MKNIGKYPSTTVLVYSAINLEGVWNLKRHPSRPKILKKSKELAIIVIFLESVFGKYFGIEMHLGLQYNCPT